MITEEPPKTMIRRLESPGSDPKKPGNGCKVGRRGLRIPRIREIESHGYRKSEDRNAVGFGWPCTSQDCGKGDTLRNQNL